MNDISQIQAEEKEVQLSLAKEIEEIYTREAQANRQKAKKEIEEQKKTDIDGVYLDKSKQIDNQDFDNKKLIGQKHYQNIEDINLQTEHSKEDVIDEFNKRDVARRSKVVNQVLTDQIFNTSKNPYETMMKGVAEHNTDADTTNYTLDNTIPLKQQQALEKNDLNTKHAYETNALKTKLAKFHNLESYIQLDKQISDLQEFNAEQKRQTLELLQGLRSVSFKESYLAAMKNQYDVGATYGGFIDSFLNSAAEVVDDTLSLFSALGGGKKVELTQELFHWLGVSSHNYYELQNQQDFSDRVSVGYIINQFMMSLPHMISMMVGGGTVIKGANLARGALLRENIIKNLDNAIDRATKLGKDATALKSLKSKYLDPRATYNPKHIEQVMSQVLASPTTLQNIVSSGAFATARNLPKSAVIAAGLGAIDALTRVNEQRLARGGDNASLSFGDILTGLMNWSVDVAGIILPTQRITNMFPAFGEKAWSNGLREAIQATTREGRIKGLQKFGGEVFGEAGIEGFGEFLQTYNELQAQANYTLPNWIDLIKSKPLMYEQYDKQKDQLLEATVVGGLLGGAMSAGANTISASVNAVTDSVNYYRQPQEQRIADTEITNDTLTERYSDDALYSAPRTRAQQLINDLQGVEVSRVNENGETETERLSPRNSNEANIATLEQENQNLRRQEIDLNTQIADAQANKEDTAELEKKRDTIQQTIDKNTENINKFKELDETMQSMRSAEVLNAAITEHPEILKDGISIDDFKNDLKAVADAKDLSSRRKALNKALAKMNIPKDVKKKFKEDILNMSSGKQEQSKSNKKGQKETKGNEPLQEGENSSDINKQADEQVQEQTEQEIDNMQSVEPSKMTDEEIEAQFNNLPEEVQLQYIAESMVDSAKKVSKKEKIKNAFKKSKDEGRKAAEELTSMYHIVNLSNLENDLHLNSIDIEHNNTHEDKDSVAKKEDSDKLNAVLIKKEIATTDEKGNIVRYFINGDKFNKRANSVSTNIRGHIKTKFSNKITTIKNKFKVYTTNPNTELLKEIVQDIKDLEIEMNKTFEEIDKDLQILEYIKGANSNSPLSNRIDSFVKSLGIELLSIHNDAKELARIARHLKADYRSNNVTLHRSNKKIGEINNILSNTFQGLYNSLRRQQTNLEEAIATNDTEFKNKKVKEFKLVTKVFSKMGILFNRIADVFDATKNEKYRNVLGRIHNILAMGDSRPVLADLSSSGLIKPNALASIVLDRFHNLIYDEFQFKDDRASIETFINALYDYSEKGKKNFYTEEWVALIDALKLGDILNNNNLSPEEKKQQLKNRILDNDTYRANLEILVKISLIVKAHRWLTSTPSNDIKLDNESKDYTIFDISLLTKQEKAKFKQLLVNNGFDNNTFNAVSLLANIWLGGLTKKQVFSGAKEVNSKIYKTRTFKAEGETKGSRREMVHKQFIEKLDKYKAELNEVFNELSDDSTNYIQNNKPMPINKNDIRNQAIDKLQNVSHSISPEHIENFSNDILDITNEELNNIIETLNTETGLSTKEYSRKQRAYYASEESKNHIDTLRDGVNEANPLMYMPITFFKKSKVTGKLVKDTRYFYLPDLMSKQNIKEMLKADLSGINTPSTINAHLSRFSALAKNLGEVFYIYGNQKGLEKFEGKVDFNKPFYILYDLQPSTRIYTKSFLSNPISNKIVRDLIESSSNDDVNHSYKNIEDLKKDKKLYDGIFYSFIEIFGKDVDKTTLKNPEQTQKELEEIYRKYDNNEIDGVDALQQIQELVAKNLRYEYNGIDLEVLFEGVLNLEPDAIKQYNELIKDNKTFKASPFDEHPMLAKKNADIFNEYINTKDLSKLDSSKLTTYMDGSATAIFENMIRLESVGWTADMSRVYNQSLTDNSAESRFNQLVPNQIKPVIAKYKKIVENLDFNSKEIFTKALESKGLDPYVLGMAMFLNEIDKYGANGNNLYASLISKFGMMDRDAMKKFILPYTYGSQLESILVKALVINLPEHNKAMTGLITKFRDSGEYQKAIEKEYNSNQIKSAFARFLNRVSNEQRDLTDKELKLAQIYNDWFNSSSVPEKRIDKLLDGVFQEDNSIDWNRLDKNIGVFEDVFSDEQPSKFPDGVFKDDADFLTKYTEHFGLVQNRQNMFDENYVNLVNEILDMDKSAITIKEVFKNCKHLFDDETLWEVDEETGSISLGVAGINLFMNEAQLGLITFNEYEPIIYALYHIYHNYGEYLPEHIPSKALFVTTDLLVARESSDLGYDIKNDVKALIQLNMFKSIDSYINQFREKIQKEYKKYLTETEINSEKQAWNESNKLENEINQLAKKHHNIKNDKNLSPKEQTKQLELLNSRIQSAKKEKEKQINTALKYRYKGYRAAIAKEGFYENINDLRKAYYKRLKDIIYDEKEKAVASFFKEKLKAKDISNYKKEIEKLFKAYKYEADTIIEGIMDKHSQNSTEVEALLFAEDTSGTSKVSSYVNPIYKVIEEIEALPDTLGLFNHNLEASVMQELILKSGIKIQIYDGMLMSANNSANALENWNMLFAENHSDVFDLPTLLLKAIDTMYQPFTINGITLNPEDTKWREDLKHRLPRETEKSHYTNAIYNIILYLSQISRKTKTTTKNILSKSEQLRDIYPQRNVKELDIYSKGQGLEKLFSNLSPRPFTYKGKNYRSVEHAYQTWKSSEFDSVAYNSKAIKPKASKKAKTDLNEEGIPFNYALMVDLIYKSIVQNPNMINILRANNWFKNTNITHNRVKPNYWTESFPRAFKNAISKIEQEQNEYDFVRKTLINALEKYLYDTKSFSESSRTRINSLDLHSIDIDKIIKSVIKENPDLRDNKLLLIEKIADKLLSDEISKQFINQAQEISSKMFTNREQKEKVRNTSPLDVKDDLYNNEEYKSYLNEQKNVKQPNRRKYTIEQNEKPKENIVEKKINEVKNPPKGQEYKRVDETTTKIEPVKQSDLIIPRDVMIKYKYRPSDGKGNIEDFRKHLVKWVVYQTLDKDAIKGKKLKWDEENLILSEVIEGQEDIPFDLDSWEKQFEPEDIYPKVDEILSKELKISDNTKQELNQKIEQNSKQGKDTHFSIEQAPINTESKLADIKTDTGTYSNNIVNNIVENNTNKSNKKYLTDLTQEELDELSNESYGVKYTEEENQEHQKLIDTLTNYTLKRDQYEKNLKFKDLDEQSTYSALYKAISNCSVVISISDKLKNDNIENMVKEIAEKQGKPFYKVLGTSDRANISWILHRKNKQNVFIYNNELPLEYEEQIRAYQDRHIESKYPQQYKEKLEEAIKNKKIRAYSINQFEGTIEIKDNNLISNEKIYKTEISDIISEKQPVPNVKEVVVNQGQNPQTAKDIAMTNDSDISVVIWNGKSKGTKANIDRAKAQGKPVYNILDSNFRTRDKNILTNNLTRGKLTIFISGSREIELDNNQKKEIRDVLERIKNALIPKQHTYNGRKYTSNIQVVIGDAKGVDEAVLEKILTPKTASHITVYTVKNGSRLSPELKNKLLQNGGKIRTIDNSNTEIKGNENGNISSEETDEIISKSKEISTEDFLQDLENAKNEELNDNSLSQEEKEAIAETYDTLTDLIDNTGKLTVYESDETNSQKGITVTDNSTQDTAIVLFKNQNRETKAHEYVHALLSYAFNVTSNAVNNLKHRMYQIMQQVHEELKNNPELRRELGITDEIYDYIFNNPVSLENGLHEFVATFLTKPKLAAYLRNRNMKTFRNNFKNLKGKTIIGTALNLFKALLKTFYDLVTLTWFRNRGTLHSQMLNLTKQISEYNTAEGVARKQQEYQNSKIVRANKFAMKVIHASTRHIFRSLDSYVEMKGYSKNDIEDIKNDIKNDTDNIRRAIIPYLEAINNTDSTAKKVLFTSIAIMKMLFASRKILANPIKRNLVANVLNDMRQQLVEGTIFDIQINLDFGMILDKDVKKMKEEVDSITSKNTAFAIEEENSAIMMEQSVKDLIYNKNFKAVNDWLELMRDTVKRNNEEMLQNAKENGLDISKDDLKDAETLYEEALTRLIYGVKLSDYFYGENEQIDSNELKWLVNSLLDWNDDIDTQNMNRINHNVSYIMDFITRNNILSQEMIDKFDAFIYNQTADLGYTRLTRTHNNIGMQNAEQVFNDLNEIYKQQTGNDLKLGKTKEEDNANYKKIMSAMHKLVTLHAVRDMNTAKSYSLDRVQGSANLILETYKISDNEFKQNMHNIISFLTQIHRNNELRGKKRRVVNVNVLKDYFEHGEDISDRVLLDNKFKPITLDKSANDYNNSKLVLERRGYEIIEETDKDITYGIKGAYIEVDTFSRDSRLPYYMEGHIPYGKNEQNIDIQVINTADEDFNERYKYLLDNGYKLFSMPQNEAGVGNYYFKWKGDYSKRTSRTRTYMFENHLAAGKVEQKYVDFDSAAKLEIEQNIKPEFYNTLYNKMPSKRGEAIKITEDSVLKQRLAGSLSKTRANVSIRTYEEMMEPDARITKIINQNEHNLYRNRNRDFINNQIFYSVLRNNETIKKRAKGKNSKHHHAVQLFKIEQQEMYNRKTNEIYIAPRIIPNQQICEENGIMFNHEDLANLYRLMKSMNWDMVNDNEIYVDTRMFPMLFGFENETFNKQLKDGKMQRALSFAGYALRGLVKETRKNVIIRNPNLVLTNFKSNLVGLIGEGIPQADIWGSIPVIIEQLQGYQSLIKNKVTFESQLAALDKDTPTFIEKSKQIQHKLDKVNRELKSHPLNFVIENGFYTNVVSDENMGEVKWDNRIIDMIQDKTNMSEDAKAYLKELALTEDSDIYKNLAEWTRLGDFVPRVILFNHLVSNEGMSKHEAVKKAQDKFINYNTPIWSKTLRNLDRFGITNYAKYFTAIQKQSLEAFSHSPISAGAVVGATMAAKGMGLSPLMFPSNYIMESILLDGGMPKGLLNIGGGTAFINNLNRFDKMSLPL